MNVPARDEADMRTLGNEEIRKSLGDIPMTLAGDEIPSEASLARNGNDWAGHPLWPCWCCWPSRVSWPCRLAIIAARGAEHLRTRFQTCG